MKAVGEFIGGIVIYLAGACFVIVGFIQWFAIIDGLEGWFGLPWWIAGFISMFLSYIPLLGSFIGYYAATEIWGWSTIGSIALFFGWMIFCLFLLGIQTLIDAWR